MQFTLLRYDKLDSTNTEAANLARRGAAEGICVVADEQTAGRGRQGRSWSSAKGDGAYFSIILRPKLEARCLSLIPLMAAVAVHDVLRMGFLIPPDIKWPNDILVGEKKISGILAEAIDTPTGLVVIVGIGLNLRNAEPDLNATSIEAESQFPADRDDLIAYIHEEMSRLYENLLADPPSIVRLWSERSSYVEGKDVTVTTGDETFDGTTAGLEENGALRVQRCDGRISIVQAGDVNRLRAV
ncbi:MAG TPA: biotin--[acetyl-CoA-carboxylase] ligase [Pyrinomonadaceae bacterium]|nr:biotin--[acetyl-CoA-carboxylase] ligase [Pyrinomonadaceae bacterium]